MKWTFLKKIGNNKIVKRTYVYLFLLPLTIGVLTKLNLTIYITAIPFSWKVLYFSALFFTLGSLTYVFGIPKVLIDNSSYSDFVNDGKGNETLETYLDDLHLDISNYANELFNFYGMDLQMLNKDHLDNFCHKSQIEKKVANFFQNYPERSISSELMNIPGIKERYIPNDNHTEIEIKLQQDLRNSFWRIFHYADTERKFWRLSTTLFFALGFLCFSIVLIDSFVTVVITLTS